MYICNHPELGAIRNCSSREELLEIKEAIFYAALNAAVEELHDRHRQLSNGLSFSALEYMDAVRYYRSAGEQPQEGKAVRHE